MLDLKEENSGLVTVLSVKGRIDSTTAPKLDERLSALLGAASARVLMDFSQLEYISSAGLVALHSMALLSRGEQLPDTEGGWSAYRSMGRSSEAGMQKHVKLLNPRSEVLGVLDMVGFGNVFEIYTDLDEAIKSF